ncbi:site-specific tyrosine recombinase XerC [Marinibactrum halimedae]|uniref:Tyrosine recombinase XerD n=1 Tax=Marinibactrum halimedae TaxID=1444977 RepID=A0AA37TB88_9GAMM|nr:site-specific tyrosine recombinase XerC [Marinibactrum halimedae]MCD9461308.1 site-specific tyrosine recombinase XerC [Marinibactrum halimedae]GLS28288.1 tyrosine recombinase XerD [Marinibactrum halimedae]
MAVKRKRNMVYRREKIAIEHTHFYAYLLRYNEAMLIRNYSDSTLHRRDSDIRRFVSWCEERGIDHPRDITKPILERYQKHLYYYRQDNGEPLSVVSQIHYLVSVKQFFKWMTQENHLLYNPASELRVPRQPSSLPVVLTVEEINQLMMQPDLTTPYGVRDRAMLEVLYSTGLRRSELCNLEMHDLSIPRQTLYVRKGKGGKDRLLPIGEQTAKWVEQYLLSVRALLLTDINNQTLFLNDYGEKFRDNKLGDRVKRYMKSAGITAPGSCHLLRHAMATHMLENGADLRFIQAMLGHANLQATQIYTHVSIRKLQEIHSTTHPAQQSDDRKAFLAALAEEADD